MSQTKPEEESSKKVEIRVTDRRPRFDTEDKENGESPPVPETRYPTFVAELEARVQASEQKLGEALDLLRRREAEADDFRARLRKEMDRRSKAHLENFLNDFLEAIDSLDRGIASCSPEPGGASLHEGFTKVRSQFLSSLARHGVVPMDLLKTSFDPELAEALALVEAQDGEPENQVVAEIRRGYTWNGQMLRTAQVQVTRKKKSASAPQPSETANEPSELPAESIPGPEAKA